VAWALRVLQDGGDWWVPLVEARVQALEDRQCGLAGSIRARHQQRAHQLAHLLGAVDHSARKPGALL